MLTDENSDPTPLTSQDVVASILNYDHFKYSEKTTAMHVLWWAFECKRVYIERHGLPVGKRHARKIEFFTNRFLNYMRPGEKAFLERLPAEDPVLRLMWLGCMFNFLSEYPDEVDKNFAYIHLPPEHVVEYLDDKISYVWEQILVPEGCPVPRATSASGTLWELENM